MNARSISTVDLSTTEQEHVRNALILLKPKFGTWKTLAKVLKFEDCTLIHVARGRKAVSVVLAYRLAKLVNVCVTMLVSGKYPNEHSCPRCGYDVARLSIRGRMDRVHPR